MCLCCVFGGAVIHFWNVISENYCLILAKHALVFMCLQMNRKPPQLLLHVMITLQN